MVRVHYDFMTMLRSLRLALVFSLLLASPAWAAVEDGGLLSINSGLMVWTVLIFLAVLFLLYKFAYPHILGAVEAREERIRNLLDEAARDREEAQALLAEQKQQMEEIRHRAQEAMAESRTSAERLKEEILAQARREQEDILARARRDITAEREAALDAVRLETVEIALAAAEKLLRKNLDTDDNRRLVRDYLSQLAVPDATRIPAGV